MVEKENPSSPDRSRTKWPSSDESPTAQTKSIRTSNRKVIGSTPDRSTRTFFLPSMPVSMTEKKQNKTKQ